MTKNEALHKALKVLNCLNNDRVYETAWVKGAINACEEALEPQIELADTISVEDYQKLREQPTKEEILGKVFDAVYAQYPTKAETQEPVAWMHCVDEDITEFNDFQACPKCEPLYTTPPSCEWQSLSDDEITSLEYDHVSYETFDEGEYGTEINIYTKEFARAIEAKLKEKNT